MVPFLLTISLRSPIILSHRTTLDGLLIGVGYQRYGAESTVETDLPLLSRDGIVHASQLLPGAADVPVVGSVTYIQSMIRTLINNIDLTEMLIKQPQRSAMSHGSGPNSNVESTYVTRNIPRVYFLGVGDVARIRSLLLTMPFIGAQSHKGNGEVEKAVVTELDVDPTWFGVVGRYDGDLVPLRPVPKRLAHLLPDGIYGFNANETWHYPYFPGHPQAVVEPCLVPPFVHGEGMHRHTLQGIYRDSRAVG